MTQWELATKMVYINNGGLGGTTDPSLLWTRKDKKTGKTDWDELTQLASEGWELISVTYIYMTYPALLYTFKRPKP